MAYPEAPYPSPVTPRSPFDILPTEILEEIFILHVNENYASRMSLLLTCRMWYQTSTNQAVLWNKLYLGDHPPPQKPPTMIFCQHLKHFVAAIRRTGGSAFELHVQIPCQALNQGEEEDYATLMDSVWLDRCRSLSIVTIAESTSGLERFGMLLRSQGFSRLKNLRLAHKYANETWENMLDGIVTHIDRRVGTLHSLDLVGHYVSRRTGFDLGSCRSIISRLRSLKISDIEQVLPWRQMESLHELSIANYRDSSTLEQYFDIPISVKSMTFRCLARLTRIPARVYSQLTHLTLEILKVFVTGPFETLLLPNLLSLRLCSSAVDLEYFDAPKLDELTLLCDEYYISSDFYPSFEDASITPRVLNLVQTPWEDEITYLIQAESIWSRLEILNVTLFSDALCLSSSMLEAITGTNTIRPFPVLRVVSVLYPDIGVDCVGEGIKIDRVREMRDLALRRGATNGSRKLERVDVGWYWAPTTTDVEDPLRTYWKFEWRDCLNECSDLQSDTPCV